MLISDFDPQAEQKQASLAAATGKRPAEEEAAGHCDQRSKIAEKQGQEQEQGQEQTRGQKLVGAAEAVCA